MPRHVVRMVAALCGALFLTVAGTTLNAQSPSPFTGRWVIEGDPWFDQLATSPAGGRGAGRAGAPAPVGGTQTPAQDVVLQLAVGPDGRVSGVASGISGRRGAPGSHPSHDVEITRGALSGDVLTFQIWRFDGFHNRVHVNARVAGDSLELEFRRDTASGPDTFITRARRAAR
jgi:hypothetical protein